MFSSGSKISTDLKKSIVLTNKEEHLNDDTNAG